MLRKTDRAFLEEMVRFQHINKAVSAIALYDAGADNKTTAAKIVKHVHAQSDEKAWQISSERNIGHSIQGAVVVKLMAETIGALEDLGSLCFAVKHRKKQSIFKRYSLSDGGDYGSFLAEVADKGASLNDLNKILRIPKLSTLKGFLTPEVYEEVERVYAIILRQLKATARYFRTSDIEGVATPSADDVVFVVYHTEDLDCPPDKPDKRGILIKSYNNIKHRFLVFEKVDDLTKALEEEEADIRMSIKTTSYSREYKEVDALKKISIGIANCMGLVAWIILTLDENDVPI